jgi:NAD(P)-dependent dehydrogenase (short-subunit alcohol dehydrogenase family)
MESQKPVAVVAGAGPGNGAALARRFVGAGYATAILSRHRSTLAPIENELATARGFECDVGDPVSVESTFARIRSELGEVDALLYNAGSGVFGDVETITPDQFE